MIDINANDMINGEICTNLVHIKLETSKWNPSYDRNIKFKTA